jgi:hypothetical protein
MIRWGRPGPKGVVVVEKPPQGLRRFHGTRYRVAMAKRELTGHQRKIVDRYYEHRDTIASTRLSEIVTELYLAESEKKREALWKRAEKAVAHLGANAARTRRVFEARDVEGLARMANELAG